MESEKRQEKLKRSREKRGDGETGGKDTKNSEVIGADAGDGERSERRHDQ